MSERPTPETDSQIKTFTSVSKLKKSFENRTGTVSAGFARRLERERDEAREELAEWHDSALNVRKEYEDEQHCSCVPILRKLLKDAERERDEAREKYRAAVINRKRECFKLHREIKDLSRQLDAIRTVFKNKAHENWEPGETLAETGARILRERDEARNLADAFHRDQVTLILERDEAQRACQLAHDRLLRGDNDREILDILAKGWRAAK